MTIKTYLVRSTAAVDSKNYSEKGFPSKLEKFSSRFEYMRNDSFWDRFSDFCELVSVRECCGQRSGCVPAVN